MDETNIMSAINKSMDRDDLTSAQAKEITNDLNVLVKDLRQQNLKISSWYGQFELSTSRHSPERINRGTSYTALEDAVDDRNYPWFLYWELAWIVLNAGFQKGQRVLDLGGSSSLFSYYLASKGLNVTTVDLQQKLVDNGNHVGSKMQWELANHKMDMRDLRFDTQFDHITSICVYEHIPMYDRININRRIKELLAPGGRFSITFDYLNPSKFARISSPEDVNAQFVIPSGLSIRGNERFVDNGKRYLLHPFYSPQSVWYYKPLAVARGHFPIGELLRTKTESDYTFGALFLENRI